MEKAEELDFKTGETVAPEAGQAEKTEVKAEEPIADEPKTENIEELKERLKKAEGERENLSKAVSRLNKEKKTLIPDKPEEEETEYPDWDETSRKFQEQTISKAEKMAGQKAQEQIEKANEKAAIDKFVAKNPDFDWNYIVSNYTPTHGRDTVEDINKDLERALILARYELGEITNLEADALKKGEKKGKAEANLADMASVSRTTSKTVKGGQALSQGALQLAQRMRVSPEKLAQEDDSLTAEIKY